MRAVKSDERNSLLQILMRLLHFLNRSQRLIDSYQSMTLDNAHTATLIHDQKIEYSFHNFFSYYFKMFNNSLFILTFIQEKQSRDYFPAPYIH